MLITIDSSSFAHGGAIPRRYTGDGEDVSPPLKWTGIPEGARELALIVDDPDAPRAEPWVHWVVYKIPADADGLGEDAAGSNGAALPAGALQGRNDFGATGYGGPAPPRGHGTHHYHFTLYALDIPLDVAPGADKLGLLTAMEGHILARGELVGTYER
ncbi:MAG: YbhB/YbcL family Raf kinase inhibitor-like protein [Thermoleophilia bacterium]